LLRLLHVGPQRAAFGVLTRQTESAIPIADVQSVPLADEMASPCHDTGKLADRLEAANDGRRNRGDVTTTSSRESERRDNPKLIQRNPRIFYL